MWTTGRPITEPSHWLRVGHRLVPGVKLPLPLYEALTEALEQAKIIRWGRLDLLYESFQLPQKGIDTQLHRKIPTWHAARNSLKVRC